jgi:hypothetical protein
MRGQLFRGTATAISKVSLRLLPGLVPDSDADSLPCVTLLDHGTLAPVAVGAAPPLSAESEDEGRKLSVSEKAMIHHLKGTSASHLTASAAPQGIA